MVPAKRFNTVRGAPVLLLLAALAVAAVVAGCGGSSNSSGSANASSSEGSVEHVSMQILTGKMATKEGYIAEDGLGHDTFMLTGLSSADASNPLVRSNLNVKVGDKVTVTVTNYDEGPHTFTSPELGVSATVAPAKNADKGIPSKTTFTFTVKKAGKFRWYCTTPCDAGQGGWAMKLDKDKETDQVGYMAGYVVAA
jgi:FtsP/CotA-like multicopper oxidase with cupredoxin domain